jgi:hypothetical protein
MRGNLEDLMRQADPAELYEMPPVTGDRDDPLYASILARKGITMADIATDQVARRRVGAQRRRWAPAVAFAAAFVIVITAVGLMSLLRSESTQPADEPAVVTPTSAPMTTVPVTTLPPTSAAPAPTTSAAPVAAPAPVIEWVTD